MTGEPSFETSKEEPSAEQETQEAHEDREPGVFRCLEIPSESGLEEEELEFLETASWEIDQLVAHPVVQADNILTKGPEYAKKFPHLVDQAEKAKEAFDVLDQLMNGTKFTGTLSVDGAAEGDSYNLTRWDRFGKEVTEKGFQGVSFSLGPPPESPLYLVGEKVALVRLDVKTGGDDRSIRVNFYGEGKRPGGYAELQSLRIDVHTARGRPPAVDVDSSVFGHLCVRHQEVPSLSKLNEEEYSPIFRLLQDAAVVNLAEIAEENRTRVVEGQPALKIDKASRTRLREFSAVAKRNLKFPGTESERPVEEVEMAPLDRLKSLVIENVDPRLAADLLEAMTEEMPSPVAPTAEAGTNAVLSYLLSLPYHELGGLEEAPPPRVEAALSALGRFGELDEDISDDPLTNTVGIKLISHPNADKLLSQLGRLEQAKGAVAASS